MINSIKKELLNFIQTEDDDPDLTDYCFFNRAEAHVLYGCVLLSCDMAATIQRYEDKIKYCEFELSELIEKYNDLVDSLHIDVNVSPEELPFPEVEHD